MSRKYLDLNKYDTYDLWKHTENHLERPRMKYPRRGNFYPSEASVVYYDDYGDKVVQGKCLRYSFYRLKGIVPAPSNARSLMIFAMGNAVESFLVEQWKQMGIWVDNNVEFFTTEYGFPLKGALDVVLAEPPDARLYGVECKSYYGYYANREIMGNSKQPGFPKYDHLLQTLVYAYIFRKELYCFRTVYMARDEPANHRSFKVEVVENNGIWCPKVEGEILKHFTVDDVFKRYRELQEYLDKDELPPRDFEATYSDEKVEDFFKKKKLSKSKYEEHTKGRKKAGDWQCDWCNFKDVCYKRASI